MAVITNKSRSVSQSVSGIGGALAPSPYLHTEPPKVARAQQYTQQKQSSCPAFYRCLLDNSVCV